MAKVSIFDELSLDTLQDIYDAEHQITEALPQMREAATTPELKDAFSLHLYKRRIRSLVRNRYSDHLVKRRNAKQVSRSRG